MIFFCKFIQVEEISLFLHCQIYTIRSYFQINDR